MIIITPKMCVCVCVYSLSQVQRMIVLCETRQWLRFIKKLCVPSVKVGDYFTLAGLSSEEEEEEEEEEFIYHK